MTAADADRTLVLIRHAEAEPHSAGGDHERVLTAYGIDCARAAGRWLHDEHLVADLVLCSTAARTRQTWDEACAAGTSGDRVVHLRGVYTADVESLLRIVREESDDCETVVVVGHNPTVGAAASMLSDGEGSDQAHEALAHGFPPATVAVLRLQGTWDQLGIGAARLERVHTCRCASSSRETPRGRRHPRGGADGRGAP